MPINVTPMQLRGLVTTVYMFTTILDWMSAGTTEPESVEGIRASMTLRNSSSTVATT